MFTRIAFKIVSGLILLLLTSGCPVAEDGAAPPATQLSCRVNADCPPEQVCEGQVCVPSRIMNSDSGRDQSRDPEPDDLGSDNQPADSSQDSSQRSDQAPIPDEGAPDNRPDRAPEPDRTTEPDSSESAPDESDECEGRDDGIFRDSCDEGSDCCNGMCLGNSELGLGFCTIECGVFEDCNPLGLPGGDYFCLSAGADGQLCAPSDFNESCSVADHCLGQVCLLRPGGSGCTWPCITGADCAPDVACGAGGVDLGTGEPSLLRVCTPVNMDCDDETDCLSGTCITPDDGGDGYCSVFCSMSDPDSCVPGMICAVAAAGYDPICVRPGDL